MLPAGAQRLDDSPQQRSPQQRSPPVPTLGLGGSARAAGSPPHTVPAYPPLWSLPAEVDESTPAKPRAAAARAATASLTPPAERERAASASVPPSAGRPLHSDDLVMPDDAAAGGVAPARSSTEALLSARRRELAAVLAQTPRYDVAGTLPAPPDTERHLRQFPFLSNARLMEMRFVLMAGLEARMETLRRARESARTRFTRLMDVGVRYVQEHVECDCDDFMELERGWHSAYDAYVAESGALLERLAAEYELLDSMVHAAH